MKWTVGSILKRAVEILRERGISSPRLDAEILLAHALGLSGRVDIYLEYHKPLTPEEVERYRKLVSRRARGEPTAYIVGKKEFYGFTFIVRRGVFVPRPETELLVDVVKEFLEGKEEGIIVDVGTGTGCIILTLCKLLGSRYRYVGVDISGKALKVAMENRKLLNCPEVEFVKSNLLKGINYPVDVVVSNPPYVKIGDKLLSEEVKRFEPPTAIYGGRDGLSVIRALIPESFEKLKEGGLLAVEVGAEQAEAVASMMEAEGFKNVKLHRDLSGIYRVVTGEKQVGEVRHRGR